MKLAQCHPLLFLITGLVWLMLASVIGVALFLAMMLGHPLPAGLRHFHVHGALVGGVVQVIVGMMLASGERSNSHPVLFAAINVGTIGMLAGFWSGYTMAVGVAGLLVLLALLSLLGEALRLARTSVLSPPFHLGFFGLACLALFVGLGVGEAMALRLIPYEDIGQARLAHLHPTVLGFVTLTIVGTMHNLFPTIVNARLHNLLVAKLTFACLPAGIILLIAGFLLTQPAVQIVAGLVILTGTLLYAYNIGRTWVKAGRPRTTVSDHLTQGTVFLVICVVTGLLVELNYLWPTPNMQSYVPFGKLHLVAYTHLAMVGFILHTAFGVLSHLLPITLAVERARTNKSRRPYLEELIRIGEQWRPVQVGALSLGTVGLVLVATLVWQFNLTSLPVHVATWVSIGLLVLSLTLFAGKVGLQLTSPPPE